MKKIRFSDHAARQMALRGATESEVVETIQKGCWEKAKADRLSAVCHFKADFTSPITRKRNIHKSVDVVFADDPDEIVIVTVKVYYSDGEETQ